MPTGHEWRSLVEDGEYQPSRTRISRGVALTTSSILLLVATLILWPILQFTVSSVSADDSTPTAILPTETQRDIASPTASATPTFTPTATHSPGLPSPTLLPLIPTKEASSPLQAGLVVLALYEAGHSHLFAYQSLATPYLRLTSGPWDDITPALSPDGRWLAFASNRAGPWDIYLLDLQSGELQRLTETQQYDAEPTWSPDGKLLAYESYDQDFEIIIQSVFDDQTMINLSEHSAADYQPTWSPFGRQLAFISNRTGEPEVWLADFDKFDDQRFTNLSSNPGMEESHPRWSPDGTSLAWAAQQGMNRNLFIWKPEQGSQYVGSGDWPVWSPDGSILMSSLSDANQSMLTAYESADSMLVLPPVILPGGFAGITWGEQPLPSPLPLGLLQISLEEPQPPWSSGSSENLNSAEGLNSLTQLSGINAPFPQLHASVNEAFQALREKVSAEAGWDFLATLENAYVPLNAPLAPGMGEDWLYTGRAFAFDTLPMNAGWVIAVPEIYGNQTYWRVYIKARFQNGSQGKPLLAIPWVFNARYAGDPLLYEQGGEMGLGIPAGYWVDFTVIAQALGWQRLPALPTWQSAFFAARFNEFVIPGNKTWHQAMFELYPAEILLTPTPILPPTLTPTRTPSWPIVSTPAP
jgi:TolB protein